MRVVEGNCIMRWSDPALAHFARMTGTLDADLRYDLEALITGLNKDNIWNKIDVLNVVQNDLGADMLLNLKGATAGAPDSILVNTPTYTSGEGFTTTETGTGDSLIEIPVDAGSYNLYAAYSGHAFCYARSYSVNTTGNYAMAISGNGSDDGIKVRQASAPDDVEYKCQGISSTRIIVQDNPVGFIGWSCSAQTQRDMVLNETTLSGTANDTYSVGSGNTTIGASTTHSGPKAAQFAAWGVGGGLTLAELQLYEIRIRNYLTARGVAVY